MGNIPSSIRRAPSKHASVLIAYLPVDKVREGKLAKTKISQRYARIFHAAMAHVFAPLKTLGSDAIPMTTANGTSYSVHPILASYVADYPEQCLVSGAKHTTCPKCPVSRDQLHARRHPNAPLRNPNDTLNLLRTARQTTSTPSAHRDYCSKHNISPYIAEPFWTGLWLADIHLSLTPDVLHQLYQGVLKHLIGWCQALMTKEEMDARVRRLPPALGVRHFKNGLSGLTQISGPDRKHMGRILLVCLVGKLDDDAITAARAIIDFIYLAQYTHHDSDTLRYMEEALDTWHDKRDYFITVGARQHFDIPKFHALEHYTHAIRMFGATNNYNTEMFERLHIDFAKKGWRASNHRNEMPQMTQWITRQETVHAYDRFVVWNKSGMSDKVLYFSFSFPQ